MADSLSEDENSEEYFSDSSQLSPSWGDISCDRDDSISVTEETPQKSPNVLFSILNRQVYGRFTKHPKAKTERAFSSVHNKCRFALSSLIAQPEQVSDVFMGFTMCGKYFTSYTEKTLDADFFNPNSGSSCFYEYEFHLWAFVPGQHLNMIAKHKIFKHFKTPDALDKIYFLQYPGDPYRIVCYGQAGKNTESDVVYISILTLPATNCRHCTSSLTENDDTINQGWCIKHGFILHFMFPLSQPSPKFDPKVSLSYPNHLVINTGHYVHILNISTLDPIPISFTLPSLNKDDVISLKNLPQNTNNFDAMSEISESASENFSTNSVVDAILEDFSEYDLESAECNKPFHELNISCEPLNVTGKNYHNTLVQNIVDPRLKRLQNSSKDYLFSIPQTSNSVEKSKIDKKIAEKAYEFTEENEKCEKLSLFRKKRLAEKKYEFSEDNSENIVPFNSLRRERRYLYRPQSRCIRSPDFNSLFLSPRSPMQSPNSRSSLRNSPHHSKSPISPRDLSRKLYVYSPSLDSDCSDSDSRLILRNPGNMINLTFERNSSGLLIVDPKLERPRWIKKIVRRYSNGDFENSSLLSGQSRDDYNIPIEIPLLVQNLTDQHLDVVPEFRADQVTEMQLIVTQKTFDCEQFVQQKAQTLCIDANLEFLHCEDYDIKVIYVCPLNGHIMCQAVIKIGALRKVEKIRKPENYTASFQFVWSISNDTFEITDSAKLFPSKEYKENPKLDVPFPKIHTKSVHVMDSNPNVSKSTLKSYDNYYEIFLGQVQIAILGQHIYLIEEYSSNELDSD